MKVICAGYWKTGTKSLAEALNILGYKVYDYDDQFFDLGELWDKFFDGRVTDEEIRKSLEDVDVLIDGPVVAFWEEIWKNFPDAKVILTLRDEDSWYKSYKGMNDGVTLSQKIFFMISTFTPIGYHFIRRIAYLVHFCQGIEPPFKMPTLNPTDNPRLYKLKYRKHNCYVKSTIPKEKLLVLNFGDGWDPLCAFLGKDVPEDTPYPHKNKLGAHMNSEGGPKNPAFKQLQRQSYVVFVILTALIGYAVYSLMFAFS